MNMDILTPTRDQVGESPVWSVAEQALWWVDIEGRQLRRHDAATGQLESWETPERIACIALHADGGLIAGMESGLFWLHPLTRGRLESSRLVAVQHAQGDMRFNDGRTDRAGRFWAGTMVRDMGLASSAGNLYRYDARGLSQPVIEGLVTANGLGFSPDNKTMYLSDSHPSVQRVWAFDLDADGTPTRRRDFIDMNAYPGRPDGAAVDTDGCYWICGNDAGQVHRFTPGGRLDRSITVPVAKPAMCAFGGADLQTLFITSIRPGNPPADEAALAGAVFVTRPGAQGLADTPFQP